MLEWVNPRNLSYLANGKFIKSDYFIYKEELERMSEMVRITPLRKIRNSHGDIAYASPECKKKVLKDFGYIHDLNLRDCLCKYLYETGDRLTVRHEFADAYREGLFFEFDNGYEGVAQLEDKLRKYYLRKGKYQVVFWMSHRENRLDLEQARLEMIMEIAKGLIGGKSRRVLANTHHGYLETGCLWDLKGRKYDSLLKLTD